MKNKVFALAFCCLLSISSTVLPSSAGPPDARLSNLLMGGNYRVTNGYNPNKVHAGIDFGGTGEGKVDVKSPVSGRIIANTEACGKIAIYDGRNTVILAHMSNLTSLAVGKSISAGTYVGKAAKVLGGGCSATGAHLHIEVRTGRNASMALPSNDNSKTTLNPVSYLVG